MTDIFQVEANAAAAAEPEASPAALPKPVKSDWLDASRDMQSKVKAERRGVIEAARDKIEAKYTTKAERLSKASEDRDVASPKERAATLGLVRKAMEKVGYQPQGEKVSDRDASNAGRSEMREAVKALQARYPGKKASEFVKIAKDWEAGFREDPVSMREKLLETYARVSPENFRDEKKEEAKQHGPSKPRDSVRRAMADFANSSDLAEFEKEFQGKLPGVLAELVKHDAALVNDPVGASARLAAAYGAPVTERQQVAFEQKRQAEQHRAQDTQNVSRALDMIVQHNVLPGMDDDATLNAIADELGKMPRTGDRLADLKAAHAAVMAGRSSAKHSAAASKSIKGAPSPRLPAEVHRSQVRNSIERAKSGDTAPSRAASKPTGVRAAISKATRSI